VTLTDQATRFLQTPGVPEIVQRWSLAEDVAEVVLTSRDPYLQAEAAYNLWSYLLTVIAYRRICDAVCGVRLSPRDRRLVAAWCVAGLPNHR